MTDGQTLKTDGIARVSMAPQDAPWRVLALAALMDLARSGRIFTAEDITDLAGRPVNPNSVGAALNAAARSGIIERVGFVSAVRAPRHGGVISAWRGTSLAWAGVSETEQRSLWGDR